MTKWISELKQFAEKNIVIYIAGNKSDMQHMRQIKINDAEEYAKIEKIKHFGVSAKANMNI